MGVRIFFLTDTLSGSEIVFEYKYDTLSVICFWYRDWLLSVKHKTLKTIYAYEKKEFF
jgi:hypothetical protein